MTRVCVVHNFYQQPGGEDQVFENEISLLESHGHQVDRFTVHNDAVASMHPLRLGGATIWNPTVYRRLRTFLQARRPDVVHVHNTLPLLSPAVYYAARHEGCAVVQTLHNYRLVCPAALLYRDGHVCEDCLGKPVAWPGVVHGCYRESRTATGTVAAMLAVHRAASTWTQQVNTYIALTPFARQVFIRGGLPGEKLIVKPNFLPDDPGMGDGTGHYALFVGRLAPEKGIQPLLDAWQHPAVQLPLKIAGDGPMADQVAAAVATHPGIDWVGRQDHDAVLQLMKDATALIFPSLWYEGFPMTLLEAFATGLPVIGSNRGALATLIRPSETGLLFAPNDAADLAKQVQWIQQHPDAWHALRPNARAEYATKYTAAANYAALTSVYANACEQAAEEKSAAEKNDR